jgi:hypothetical protein
LGPADTVAAEAADAAAVTVAGTLGNRRLGARGMSSSGMLAAEATISR